MIRDILDYVCRRCWTTPRRLEVIDLGAHVLWFVRCRCTTAALMLVVTDGSPIDFGTRRAA
jgi:hypothetical protein